MGGISSMIPSTTYFLSPADYDAWLKEDHTCQKTKEKKMGVFWTR